MPTASGHPWLIACRCKFLLATAVAMLLQPTEGHWHFRETMLISGAGTFLDGRYIPIDANDEIASNRCYEKDDGYDAFLCLCPAGHWIVQPKDKIGTNYGYMMSQKRNSQAPQNAGPWSVYSRGTWSMDLITVDVDQRAISLAVATMGLGALVVTSAIVWLALAAQPGVRDMLYNLLSGSFVTFIAWMVATAFWDFIFHTNAKGFPKNTLFMQMILGIVGFTSCYFMMALLAWKCQYSFFRVAVVRWLGAFITAYFGIVTATATQREAIRSWPHFLMKHGHVTLDQAELLAVVGVMLVAFIVIYVYREASRGIRSERFGMPPEKPWSTKPPVVQVAVARSCMPCAGGGVKKAPIEATQWFRWQEQLEWGEDTAAILIQSYLLNQTIFFAKMHQLPSLEDPFFIYGKGEGEFWAALGLVFFFSALAVVSLRRSAKSGTRTSRTIENSVAMSASWCLDRLIDFVVSLLFPDSGLAPAAAAFLSTMFAVLVARLLGDSGKRHIQEDPASWQYYVFIISLCFGNIVGSSWAQVFDVCIETGVGYTGVKDGAHALAFAGALVLTIVAGALWWRVILPRSAMVPDDVSKLIDAELRNMDME